MQRFISLILFGVLSGTCYADLSTVATFAEKECGYVEGDTLLIVPANIKRIPDGAFKGMKNIREVRFPGNSSLKEIGEYAFWQCTSLRRVRLPLSVTKIEEGCFQECNSLRSIELPSGITELPRYAFAWCENLTDVSLPPSLLKVGPHAFAYCDKLQAIKLPVELQMIGMCSFSRCGSLKNVVIPDGVKVVDSYAFSECEELYSVTLPAGCNELGELIFSGCRDLHIIYSHSLTPPEFECDSYLFEPDEEKLAEQIRVIVPAESEASYRNKRVWNKLAIETE